MGAMRQVRGIPGSKRDEEGRCTPVISVTGSGVSSTAQASAGVGVAAHVTAKTVAASAILGMATADLEQAVVKELQENPALEMQMLPPADGAAETLAPPARLATPPRDSSIVNAAGGTQATSAGADEFDPLAAVCAPMTLPELLYQQLCLQVATADEPVAAYLVWNLDEHGYLPTDIVADAAEALGVTVDSVTRVLAQLQELDPPGIGARDLRECLLLQLAQLQAEGVVCALAEQVVRDYLADIGHRRWGGVARALGVRADDVQAAAAFIKKNLNPYPAQQYYPARAMRHWERPAMPSVLISEDVERERYVVEIVESRRFALRINPLYRALAESASAHGAQLTPAEREHISTYLERAVAFLSALRRRYRILYDIADVLVTTQREFLRHGPLYLRYLTQAMVAEQARVHPSTVSRATSGKFALLPDDTLSPLSIFFAAELKVREVLRRLIADEEAPLSDQRLSDLLAEQGVPCSRQMVAVHREQMGVPSARERARRRRAGI